MFNVKMHFLNVFLKQKDFKHFFVWDISSVLSIAQRFRKAH